MQQLGVPWPSHQLSHRSFSPQFGAPSATQTEALSFLQQHDLLASLAAPPSEAQLRHLLTIATSNAGALPDQAEDAEVAAAGEAVAVRAAPSSCGAPSQGAHTQAGSLRQHEEQRFTRQPMQQQVQQLFSYRYGGSSAAVPVSKGGTGASTPRAQRRSGSGCVTNIGAASEGRVGALPLHFHAGGAPDTRHVKCVPPVWLHAFHHTSLHHELLHHRCAVCYSVDLPSSCTDVHPLRLPLVLCCRGVTWDRQSNQWRTGVPTDWACQIGG